MTAANDTMGAGAADTSYYDDIDGPGDPDPGDKFFAYELEQYEGDTTMYRHGEFNLHLFNAIKRVCPDDVSVTYETAYVNFPLENADTNNDLITSFSEAFDWIKYLNSNMRLQTWEDDIFWDDPQLSDSSDISSTTSIKYPTIIFEDVDADKTVRGLIGVTLDFNVLTGNTLTFIDNADVYLLNNKQFTVDQGGTLVIGDNVTFTGDEGYNKIIINGNLNIGTGVVFNSIEEIEVHGLTNTFSYTTFNDNSILVNYGTNLIIGYSSFNDCDMACSNNANVTISYTDFNNTWLYLYLSPGATNKTASISHCQFDSYPAEQNSAILLRNYDEFNIQYNEISGYNAGIDLRFSGDGIPINRNVNNNTIYNNTTGILLYSSNASVAANNVYNNGTGVEFQNASNVSLFGYPSDIQYILDNDSYEVYASEESFPWYFRYNEIVDEDNQGNPYDPLVYHNTYIQQQGITDIRYNCWGDAGFSPSEDFYPAGNYTYLPLYCAGKKEAPVPGPDEIMYNNAYDEFEAGNYSIADSIYLSLINDYNESVFAHAAVKDLFSLEYFTNNAYNNLRDYYRTNDSIIADSTLLILADFMANRCDVKLENWQTAINWYENIIQDPPTFEDSIFAVIDLGYIYLQIDTSELKSILGTMSEFKPNSLKEFEQKYYDLLSLLPGSSNENENYVYIEAGQAGVLLQNTPNPFNLTTRIDYLLNKEGQISLEFFDFSGKKIRNQELGYLDKGLHTYNFSVSRLKPGIYLYSLKINNQIVDTKKMSIF